MRRDFEFDGMSVVEWSDKHIDLHNAYDILTFGTSREGEAALLAFRRNSRASNPDSLP